MYSPSQPGVPSCPDPWTRTPRRPDSAAALHVPAPLLHGPVLCVISRDTRAAALQGAQLLTHLPATPFVCLSVFQQAQVGRVQQELAGPVWHPFGSRVMLSGSQSAPLVTWSPGTGRAALVFFTPENAQQLFGLEPAAIHDCFFDAYEELEPHWWPMLDALQSSVDDASTLDVLERHIAPRWRALRGEPPAALPSLRQIGRHWLESIAVQARQWGHSRSTRQVERRIKALSGRSMREWGALLKAESVFFAARDRYDAGLPLDWAELAAEEGFADQSHLVRAARRITGFTPTAFAQRYVEDESFWLYRLWV